MIKSDYKYLAERDEISERDLRRARFRDTVSEILAFIVIAAIFVLLGVQW